jgi:hypothetical protein
MGFLDKAARAAAQAKTQVDTVRAARAEAAIQPVDPGPLDEHERQVYQRAIQLGALDPLQLLTSAEASAAAGQQLGGPGLTYSDDTLGVQFEARGRGNDHWRVELHVYHPTEPGVPFEAELYLREMVLDNDPDATPVEGVAHGAFMSYDMLWVRYGPILFYVTGTTPQGPLGLDGCVVVARQVAARLEQLDRD